MPVSDVRVWDGTAWVSLRGPTGNTGSPGTPATITIEGVTTLANGQPATVTDSDPSPSNSKLTFGIPAGPPGTAATIQLDPTVTGNAGTQASVTNLGTASAARFAFVIPKGDKGDTGAAAVIKGTSTAWPPAASPATNDLYILGNAAAVGGAPASGVGAAVIGDGVVWTGTAWVNVGPLRGPQGLTGNTGAPGVTPIVTVAVPTITLAAGANASVVDTDSDPNKMTLQFSIPRGADGPAGQNAQVYNTVTTPVGMNQGAIWLVP
jgi:hypothetical protein